MERRPIRRRALYLAVAATGLLLAAPIPARTAGSPPPDLVVAVSGRSVNLAGFRALKGTLGDALDVFGRASSRRRDGVVCEVRWQAIGLRIFFANLGGGDPCSREYGYPGSARITSARWRTSRGLRVGQAARRIPALYPRARREGRVWILATATDPSSPTNTRDVLRVEERRGRAFAFDLSIGAAGE